jgi:HSP20 family protein
MLTRWSYFTPRRWRRIGRGDFDRTFASFDSLWTDVDRWLGLERPFQHAFRLQALPTAWPRMTWSDAGERYLVRAEVPGIEEKDLEISLENHTLTIRGKRTVDPPEGYTAHRRERGNLEFARSITLPENVLGDEVTARLEDGVLELSVPKKPEAEPRQIPVKSS